jgi:hypothetical protein
MDALEFFNAGAKTIDGEAVEFVVPAGAKVSVGDIRSMKPDGTLHYFGVLLTEKVASWLNRRADELGL